MADNKQIAKDVLEAVGGASNVTLATNCMTRLRLTLKDNSKANVDEIKKIDGVLGAQFSGVQLQVIIGQNVPKVLDEFIALSGVARGDEVDENLDKDLDAPKPKITPAYVGNVILDYVSSAMTQLIPVLLGGGLLRTIATILGPSMLGLITEDSGIYVFFYDAMYEAGFYFLPIYLGYTAAKKLGATPVLGMFMGAALMAPTIIDAASAGETINVYGITIEASTYSQTVLPILLTIPIMAFFERNLKKVMPDSISAIFTPFCTLLLTIPFAFLICGPFGNACGNVLYMLLNAISSAGGIMKYVAMVIIGGIWQLCVVGGMHIAIIVPFKVAIIEAGYDTFLYVSTNAAMVAVWGCIFGAMLRMPTKKEKSLATGYFVSAVVGGITEPALFGLVLRFKGVLVSMMIGGAAGALVSGILGVTYYIAGGGSNFLAIVNYLQGGTSNVIVTLIGWAVSFAVAAVLTYMIGFSKEEMEEMKAAEA